jgi:hypothetical protein
MYSSKLVLTFDGGGRRLARPDQINRPAAAILELNLAQVYLTSPHASLNGDICKLAESDAQKYLIALRGFP